MEKKKTITNIFKIHSLTYVFIFIALLTAKFKNIIFFMSIILFHELGHFLTARIFNWKVDKIYIYPLGGLTKFNDNINKPIIEELLVTIMGPLFQIIISFIINNYYKDIMFYNNILLLFNLLPIAPLDGSKLLSIFLSFVVPFKTSMKIVIKISYFVYIIVLFFSIIKINSIFFVFIVLLLIFKIMEEEKKIDYYFNKFIVERYLYYYNFKRIVLIDNIKKMYKYKNNIFKENNKILNEKDAIADKISI